MAAVAALASPAAAQADQKSGLRKSLARAMEAEGGAAGAFVRDGDTGERLFAWDHTKPRILASNTKLFTLGAALSIRGPGAKLRTVAAAAHPLKSSGVVAGSLYLVGGGDPAFGSESFVQQQYGGGATAERLAGKLRKAGLREVKGRVYGDESLFDSRRSGPGTDPTEIPGVLSALAFNHGLTLSNHLQDDPAAYAAQKFTDALRGAGIKVGNSARRRPAPDGAAELSHVESPSMRRLAELTAVPSDNYFAELLAKGIGGGTTAGGAHRIEDFAKTRDAPEVQLADGSGLSRSDRTTPQQLVKYLDREQRPPDAGELYRALPVAGETGTLAARMRSGYAHRNCHAKTGTLHDVSALSGYCEARDGHTLVFSILMNEVSSTSHAEDLQDKMAEAIAKYDG